MMMTQMPLRRRRHFNVVVESMPPWDSLSSFRQLLSLILCEIIGGFLLHGLVVVKNVFQIPMVFVQSYGIQSVKVLVYVNQRCGCLIASILLAGRVRLQLVRCNASRAVLKMLCST